MTTKSELEAIIEEYFRSASPEQAAELKALLKKRKKTPGVNINMDFSKLAAGMAKSIKDQMGITEDQVKRTAREMVAQMILQYDPNIKEEHLVQLVEHFLPGRSKLKIPVDILKSMIEQFIAYATGTMPKNELEDLPKGWEKQYWEHFPEKIQKLIGLYLKDEIIAAEFWATVNVLLDQ